MIMYRHLSGVVDTILGSEAEEDFDPHRHRRVPQPISYLETMSHMLKGCLGAGLLAMPNAVSRMGLIFGGFGIIFIAVFCTYCLQVLILAQYQICKRRKCGYLSYAKSMRLAVESGPQCMRWSANIFAQGVDTFLFFWQLGICAIYFVFVAENLKQVLDNYGYDVEVRLLICYCFPFLLLLCIPKNLKLLTPISTMSNIFTVVGLVLTFYYLIDQDLPVDEDKFKLKAIGEIPVFIGITLFSLEAVGVVLALEYNMKNPKNFTGLCGLFSVSMGIIMAIYTTLGIFGYLGYGDDCKGSITLNLPRDEIKAQIAKLTFATALFLSYPLQNYVAWQIAWRKLRKKFNKKPAADYMIRIICATLPFLMAVGAPSLGPFMGLAGALCLSLVAILFPAVMDAMVYYPNEYGCCRYKLFVDIFIILFGMFCCCSGVYTSILEIIEGE